MTDVERNLSEDEIAQCREAAVRLLVQNGYDPDEPDYFGDSARDSTLGLLAIIMARTPRWRANLLDCEANMVTREGD